MLAKNEKVKYNYFLYMSSTVKILATTREALVLKYIMLWLISKKSKYKFRVYKAALYHR